ncbi:MAG TPA: YggT family protein [Dehalococcoidia bacterium]|nr:YggT family protein [Dehalococcoidia bacterium]
MIAFFYFIIVLCDIFSLLVIAQAIISWFSPSPTNWLAIILYRITEPFLAPLRRIIPRASMFDFTLLLAI